MKKIIITVLAVLMITSSAYADYNITSMWGSMKDAATTFASDTKTKAQDINWTKVKNSTVNKVVKTKNAVIAASKAAKTSWESNSTEQIVEETPEERLSRRLKAAHDKTAAEEKAFREEKYEKELKGKIQLLQH